MNPNTLSVALKEWDLLCSTLLEGTQMILLRKGGILESANEFELEHRRFLLFPTFVHQDPKMLKPPFRANVVSVRAEPEKVTLRGYGEVARIFEVPSRPALERLDDLHMWDAPMLDMRFGYRPEKPLYLVIVRGWKLPAPVIVENSIEYAGCKSWVPLFEGIDITGATTPVSDEKINALVHRVAETFKE